jgi:hypothetical protein
VESSVTLPVGAGSISILSSRSAPPGITGAWDMGAEGWLVEAEGVKMVG